MMRKETFDIVKEFDDHTIVRDGLDESTVQLIRLHIFQIRDNIFGLHDFSVIAHLNNLIPNIQAHHSKLVTFPFPYDFKVGKRDIFCDFSHSKAEFGAAHHLVLLEVVVLLYPESADVLNFGMELSSVDEDFLFVVEEGVLDLG